MLKLYAVRAPTELSSGYTAHCPHIPPITDYVTGLLLGGGRGEAQEDLGGQNGRNGRKERKGEQKGREG